MFKYQSGRVIALGRVMLGALFLIAVLLDPSEPSQGTTYGLLALYLIYALVLAAATWRNWWLDARLALPTHLVDMAVFTALVFSINGYTSPFFLFFVLPLWTATIRWTWRETAITAGSLVILYLMAASLVAGTGSFELQRFIVRSGHLMILSALLIWFGIHQRFTRLFFGFDDLDSGFGNQDEPLSAALGFAVKVTKAQGGALILGSAGQPATYGRQISDGQIKSVTLASPLVRNKEFTAFLYDVKRDRALTTVADRRACFASAADVLDLEEAARLRLDVGLVAEVWTGTEHGWLVLQGIPDLSTDFIELGREIGRAAGAILDRHALLSAIEISAGAGTRLSLARDVHDGIVQFLAGAAFRIEAIKRASRDNPTVTADLDDLKRLLVEEQGEIRGFIHALRRDRELELGESVEELRSLARRLGEQWSIDCQVTARDDTASIPIRLQLDLQQLLRESVANAVRHGGADRVGFDIAVDGQQLRLQVSDNGSGFPAANATPVEPRSLKERAERAKGSLQLVSAPGSTTIEIALPLTGAAA
ncbi:MAG: ATP-binding protein [Pseudomonadota bacterium]